MVATQEAARAPQPAGTGPAPEPARPAPTLALEPALASWEAYYGQLLLSDGLAAIPRALYLYQAALGLSAQQVWFVACLLATRWADAWPCPSLGVLAAQTGVAIRTLQYLRAALEEPGWLRVTPDYDPRQGQRTNVYDFAGLLAALEIALAVDPPGAVGEEELEDDGLSAGEGRDPGFLARYGRVILRRGMAAIPRALYRYQGALGLSPQQVWFVSYVLAYQVRGPYPYPSLVKMAARTGYTPKTLHTLKQSLVAAGYLRVVGRVGPQGVQESNGYDWQPLFAALSRQVAQDRAAGAPAEARATGPNRGAGSAIPVQATTQTPVQATTQSPVQESEGGASHDPDPGASHYPVPGATSFTRVDSRLVESESVESDAVPDAAGTPAPPARADSGALDRGRTRARRPGSTRAAGPAPEDLVARVREIATQLEALAPPGAPRQAGPEIAATTAAILALWAAYPQGGDGFASLLAAVLAQTRRRAPGKPVGYFLKVLGARWRALDGTEGGLAPVERARPLGPPEGTLLAETLTGLARVWRLPDDPGTLLHQVRAVWAGRPDLGEADLVRLLHTLVPAAAAAPAGPARLAALLDALAAALAAPALPGPPEE